MDSGDLKLSRRTGILDGKELEFLQSPGGLKPLLSKV